MKLTVFPGNPLRGEVSLPGDKSLSHRAALFAALAEGESVIDHFLVSGVTHAMLEALKALGVQWELEGCRLRVWGSGLKGLNSPVAALNCGNSATTLRLLAGALAGAGVSAVLDGSEGLRSRPMGRIIEPLRAMGVEITAAPQNRAPLALSARSPQRALKAIEYTLPVASAQVKSCLLLAALAADGPTILHEPSLSRDHTERMLASMGVHLVCQGTTTILEPPAINLQPLHVSLPGDFSSAAFLIVAALITPGSQVLLRRVGLNPTRTGLLEALLAMGADIQAQPCGEQSGEPVGDLLVKASSLKGVEVAGDLVVRMIDEFPAFAAAACFARGPSEARDAQELRAKESDRIAALCQELRALNAPVTETENGFIIQDGGIYRGGITRPHGDHRLAMALALVGLAAQGAVTIQEAEIINESFPEFTQDLSDLGARLAVEA